MNQPPSLVEQTADRLRQAIFGGDFPPGAALRELRIAKEFGVSQATVREALQRLEHSGLVVRRKHLGTTVTRLSPKDIRERVTLRALLEVLAATEAAERMDEADYQELDRLLARMTAAVNADDYYGAAQADLAFHRYIWSCSGNDTLCRTLEQITVPLFAFISILRSLGLQHLPDVTAAHEPLVAALRTRDPATIARVFRDAATSSYLEFTDGLPGIQRALAFGLMRP